MILSLNEVETTAKKAARGARYPWGLAEEAGKATRWLCSHDVDGCAALAGLLDQIDRATLAEWAPDPRHDPWAADGGTHCPLVTGAAISDRAHMLHSQSIRIGKIAEPAMLVPFAASAARQINATVTITWPDTVVCTDGDNLAIDGICPAQVTQIDIRAGGTITDQNRRQSRATPTADTWQILCRFAHRTYAPATEESRQKGAGAGVSDND